MDNFDRIFVGNYEKAFTVFQSLDISQEKLQAYLDSERVRIFDKSSNGIVFCVKKELNTFMPVIELYLESPQANTTVCTCKCKPTEITCIFQLLINVFLIVMLALCVLATFLSGIPWFLLPFLVLILNALIFFFCNYLSSRAIVKELQFFLNK